MSWKHMFLTFPGVGCESENWQEQIKAHYRVKYLFVAKYTHQKLFGRILTKGSFWNSVGFSFSLTQSNSTVISFECWRACFLVGFLFLTPLFPFFSKIEIFQNNPFQGLCQQLWNLETSDQPCGEVTLGPVVHFLVESSSFPASEKWKVLDDPRSKAFKPNRDVTPLLAVPTGSVTKALTAL